MNITDLLIFQSICRINEHFKVTNVTCVCEWVLVPSATPKTLPHFMLLSKGELIWEYRFLLKIITTFLIDLYLQLFIVILITVKQKFI